MNIIIDPPTKWDREDLKATTFQLPEADCVFAGMRKNGVLYFDFSVPADWNDAASILEFQHKKFLNTLREIKKLNGN